MQQTRSEQSNIIIPVHHLVKSRILNILFLIFSVFYYDQLASQEISVIDSLEAVLENSVEDTNKVKPLISSPSNI